MAAAPTKRGVGDALAVQSLRCLARRDVASGLIFFRRALDGGLSPGVLARVRPVLLRAEGRGPRGEPAAPRPPERPATPAWERAWAGDLQGARTLAEAEPEGASSLGVLGAVAMLERRSLEAVALLDRALALHERLPAREELVLLRARALVHLGRLEEAKRTLAALVEGESFARRAMIALVSARAGQFPFPGPGRKNLAARELLLNGFYVHELPAVVGAAEVQRALGCPRELGDRLERVLDRMAGNLGGSPTFAEVTARGEHRFVRFHLPVSTRSLAVDALDGVRRESPARVEAALTQLGARFPGSVHPRLYRGELHLWQGRYAEAGRDFLSARLRAPARWADIGLLAVLLFTGHLRCARLAAIHTERRHMPIPGGTLPVYRGVLRRRQGDLDGAVADLRDAVAAKPTRIGARMELVLALRATGSRAAAAEHMAVLVRDAAPLLVDAAGARGLPFHRDATILAADEVLEEALRAMRGNRSSSIVTWVDRSGELRVLPSPAALEREALQALAARG